MFDLNFIQLREDGVDLFGWMFNGYAEISLDMQGRKFVVIAMNLRICLVKMCWLNINTQSFSN